jgi:hypothetical protein
VSDVRMPSVIHLSSRGDVVPVRVVDRSRGGACSLGDWAAVKALPSKATGLLGGGSERARRRSAGLGPVVVAAEEEDEFEFLLGCLLRPSAFGPAEEKSLEVVDCVCLV